MNDSHAPSRDAVLESLRAAIIWIEPSIPGISVAALSDNSAIDDNALIAHLDKREYDRARAITDPVEKRHYIFRRCFQRFFIKTILNWKGALGELTIEHQLDTAPRCLDAPNLLLSFSSSGATAIACASTQRSVGIDIEKRRPVMNVVDLAARFFTPPEAAAIAALPISAQNWAFFEHWTAKEAGLKAIGKGIVSGLNSFVLNQHNDQYTIDYIDKFGSAFPWKLHHSTFVPDHIVAVVHSGVAPVHNLEK